MIDAAPLRARLWRTLERLRRDRAGMAAVEFALALPVLVGLAMYGGEAANMAYTSQRLGDLSSVTADNVSRVRISITNGGVTDILSGMKVLGDPIDFRNRGRIIVSSIAPVVDGSGNVTNQQLRWQRCTGALNKTSAYGTTEGANIGAAGVGPTGRKITASKDSELIFVEIYYTYRPLISASFFGTPEMSSMAAAAVRERNGTANDILANGSNSPCTTYAA